MSLKPWTEEAKELQASLLQFTGTEAYHRVSTVYPWLVVSDGVKFLLDYESSACCGSHWLVDLIAWRFKSSKARLRPPEAEEFASLSFWDIKVLEDDSFVIVGSIDSDRPPVAKYPGKFTDFPLPEVRLYLANAPTGEILFPRERYLLYLPSEY